MSGMRIGFGLGLAIFLGLMAPVHAFSDEADDALRAGVAKTEEARQLQDAGNFGGAAKALIEAVKHLDRVVQLRPEEALGYTWRGRAHRLEAETERALSDFDTAIRLNPRLVMAYQARGLAYVDLKRIDEAMRDFNEAIRLDPNGASSYVGRAEALANEHKSREALADYATAIRLQPNDLQARVGRAGLLVELGDAEGALAGVDDAVRIDPNDVKVRQLRSMLLTYLKKRPEQAIEDLDKVIEREPKTEHFLLRGTLLAGLGRNERALQDLNEVVRSDPKADRFGARAVAYYNLGKDDLALRDLDEAIRLEPKSASYYGLRSGVQMRLKNVDLAIRDCDEAIRLDPNVLSNHEIRAALAEKVGDFEGAFRQYDEALRLDAGRGASLYFRDLLSVVLDRDTPAGAARAYLGRKGWRDDAAPSVVLAGYLVERRSKRAGEARALLDEAVQRCDPKAWPMPVVRCLHGDETEESLLKAPDAVPGQTDVHLFLGLDRLLSGERAAAVAHLRKAAEAGDDDRFASMARAVLRRTEPPKAK